MPAGADQHRIGGEQKVLIAAVLRPLPGQFRRVDEHEPPWCAATNLVVRERIGGEANDV